MWGQTKEMTAGRQLSYHCPSVVATLEQVQLFVSQCSVLEGNRQKKDPGRKSNRQEI